MLSVKGIYENGHITLLEEIPNTQKVQVIVTVLDNDIPKRSDEPSDLSLFDDLIGAVSCRNDGSMNHDLYLTEPSR